MFEKQRHHHRGRRLVVLSVATAGAGVMAVTGSGVGSPAGASRVSPSTTIVLASGAEVAKATTALDAAVRDAIGSAWSGVAISDVVSIDDGVRDYVTATGTIGDDLLSATIYRRYDAGEMELAGLDRLPSRSGRSWVGATDPDLTSVYHVSTDGVAVRVGLTPATNREPRSARYVQALAEQLAGDGKVDHVAKGGDR